MSATASPVDDAKLNDFLGQMIADLGGAANAPLMVIGDKLGLYRTLAASGPISSADLATRTGTAERFLREWLAAQAAAGYVVYDPVTDTYAMSPEQA